MANKYLIWKQPACSTNHVEWTELSSREFFHLLKSAEGKNRYFVMLNNDICPDADVIFIEATKEQYQDWYTEFYRHRYLSRFSSKHEMVSLDAGRYNEKDQLLHDIVADTRVDVEGTASKNIMIKMLPYAIATLSDNCKEAIILKYFQYQGLSDREIAQLHGINAKVFEKRRERALRALKNFFKN